MRKSILRIYSRDLMLSWSSSLVAARIVDVFYGSFTMVN